MSFQPRLIEPEVVNARQPQAIKEVSPLTKGFMEIMRNLPVGTVMTYENLAKAQPCGSIERAKYYLTRARKHLINEGQSWEPVFGIGLKRLNDSQIIDVACQSRERIGRIVYRTRKQVESVDYKSLSNEDKLKYATSVSTLATIALFSSDRAQKKISNNIENGTIELGKMISLFADEK